MPYEQSLEGQALLPDSNLVTIETPGTWSAGRDPVRINLILREFLLRNAFRGSFVESRGDAS
jgi:hypothetical protein